MTAEGCVAGSRPRVVFTDDTIHAAAADRLAASCDVCILDGSYPSEDRLAGACADAVAILARMGTVTQRVIEAAPDLRIIARHGIGVDAVDMDAATRHGVIVTTTGSINAGAVAEYTFAMLLGLARKIAEADNSMRSGEWSRRSLVGLELAGKTLGLYGLGGIGSLVARQARGFDMRVIAHDPFVQPQSDLDVEMTTEEDLLARADIISLHLRLTQATAHIIDARKLAMMRPGSVLVNTARGELVDEAALMGALQSGRLAGAALDVFEVEPLSADSPLRGFRNVLLSPHVAGQTGESMRLVAIEAADAILDALAGRVPRHVHNPDALDAWTRPI